MRILAIRGSLRAASINAAVLEAAALLAPAGTAPDIIAKVNAATNEALKAEKTKVIFDDLGIVPGGDSPAALKVFVAVELEKWAPIIKAANITLE